MLKRWLAWLAALTLALGAVGGVAEDRAALTAFGFSESGGMENTSLEMTLALDADGAAATLTIARRDWDGEATSRHAVPARALTALDDFLRANCPPEDWAALPESEIFALDAPPVYLSAAYADGASYSLSDSCDLPEDSAPLFWAARRFLESYAADARMFEARVTSFGGEAIVPALSAPEVVDWTSRVDGTGDPVPLYDVVFTFRGRVPGETELYFEIGTPSTLTEPVDGAIIAPQAYRLVVDDDYNVTCEEDDE